MDVGEKRKRGRPRLTESTRKRRRQDNIHINQVCYYNTFSYAGIIEADTRSKMTSTQLTSTPASASFIDVEKTPSVSAPESQIASRKSPESPAKAVMRPFRDVKKKESLSFLDPFDITIDITLQESDEEADDDPDFEPDFHMSSVLPENLQNFPDVTFEEAVFGQEEAAESDGMSGRPQKYTLVLPTNTEQRGFLRRLPYLCNNSPLRQQLWKDGTLGRHAATEVSISLKVLPNSADIPCTFCGPILEDSPTRPVPISSWKGCSHTRRVVRNVLSISWVNYYTILLTLYS
ncbi:uncharacterized protein LOC128241173 [Mya arenaria]|uniref:uncharacterized protein LOC128241173 n=1 Tax=Mya arenaria TaxID=6604 RepID=UPI0022E86DEB|nr:uncharacterized protein LOC128241173 [Mya arenaria]